MIFWACIVFIISDVGWLYNNFCDSLDRFYFDTVNIYIYNTLSYFIFRNEYLYTDAWHSYYHRQRRITLVAYFLVSRFYSFQEIEIEGVIIESFNVDSTRIPREDGSIQIWQKNVTIPGIKELLQCDNIMQMTLFRYALFRTHMIITIYDWLTLSLPRNMLFFLPN